MTLLIKDSLIKNGLSHYPMPPFHIRQLPIPSFLPHYNKRRVLQVIRRLGEASKADFERQTNLANTVVSTIVSANFKPKN